jgi:c-di-AMP phosphodiesterase-like protein
MIDSLCPPAILYLGFSLTQIIIDTFKGFYNTAFFKTIVMIIFTLILNILCKKGLSIISWIIVFIPFILMTYITAVLLFVFGLSPSSDKIDYNVTNPYTSTIDQTSNTVIIKNPSNNVDTTNNNEEYDPNDYTSGTPEDINNYN